MTVQASATNDAADRLASLLRGGNLTVAVAESMTGGAVAEALVAVDGSSEWLAGGVVAYMSRVKHRLLGVQAERIISPEAAREMADGVCRLFETEIGIATTGCAGPDVMEDQPVGTTWIGVAVAGRVSAQHFRFDGDPGEIKGQAARTAIDITVRALSEMEPS